MQRIGDYIKDIVYGANDGIITTFAVVAGASGATLPASIIVIIGLANLFADGFSMAASNYLGTRSEHMRAIRENDPSLHLHRGNELIPAAITFVAFVSAGFLPLMPFLVLDYGNTLAFSVAATATALFCIGACRAFFTGQRFLPSGLEMLAVGGIAAAVAYMIGAFVSLVYHVV
jgi:predicted membrane protein (TIGR00267 family)